MTVGEVKVVAAVVAATKGRQEVILKVVGGI